MCGGVAGFWEIRSEHSNRGDRGGAPPPAADATGADTDKGDDPGRGGIRSASAERVFLPRSAQSGERARFVRTPIVPPGWASPDFDDSTWTPLPVGSSRSGSPQPRPVAVPGMPGPPPAIQLWTTPSPPSLPPVVAPPALAPPLALPAPATTPGSTAAPAPAAAPVAPGPGTPAPAGSPPDLGMIWPDDAPPPATAAAAAGTPIASPSASANAGPPGANPPLVGPPAVVQNPACIGAVYLRRAFDVAELRAGSPARLTHLTLRVRYSDGFVAYLNGTEVARRRMPDGPIPGAGTLALDRGTVEPESYYLPLTTASGPLLRPQGNVLALEVHPKSIDRCARVDAELLGGDGPRAVRGPYIERLEGGNLDLTLETDLPASVEVRFGRGETGSRRDRVVTAAGPIGSGMGPGGEPLPQTLHRVRIAGLRPGTTYHYRVSLRSEGSPGTPGPAGGAARVDLPEVTFHTPPSAGRPLRLVVYGDSRSGHAIHAQAIQSILDEDPDLVLNTGDVVERGTEEGDWDRYFTVAGPLISKIPVYLTPGNHEYARRGQGALRLFSIYATMFPVQAPLLSASEPVGPKSAARAPALLTPQLFGDAPPAPPALGSDAPLSGPGPGPDPAAQPPAPAAAPVPAPPPPASIGAPAAILPEPGRRGFYSLDVAGVHLIAIDSNQYRQPDQLRWLEADLIKAQTRRPRATVVWMHEGPFSMGWHGDSAVAIRDYVPLFERYKVSAVFSGHDHDYERGRRGQLSYFVTGGGGAELRPLKCGVPGKRKCKHPPLAFFNEHNYLLVDVMPGGMRVCPRRIDGTPLEECQTLKLPR